MAKVAVWGPSSSNHLHFGGVASKVTAAVKRKTPSELRGEQLKRRNVMEHVDESPAPLPGLKNTSGVISGLRKPDLSKNPRYIDTRMDEVFPVKKNSIRLRLLSRKENAKKENNPAEHTGRLENFSVPSDLAAKRQPQLSCGPEDSLASTAVAKDGMTQACKTIEKCSESTFRNVKELSLGGEKLSCLETVDLDNALKGLVARKPPSVSTSPADSSERIGDFMLENLCSDFHIHGRKMPLDFTLKTTMRVVSYSSVNWFHRVFTSGTHNCMPQFMSQFVCFGDPNMSCSSGLPYTTQIYNPKALHSWVYPQSSLPPSVISALTLSAVDGVETDFLSKRRLAWEDSFRSLYYMLRKNVCNIFYVCTAQFVVMFTAADGSTETKRLCNAYISQSTRGLRSLLREHDICFSMPLCHSKVEQVTTEDLVELSEIEKQNLFQIQHLGFTSDVDNSPQSLLVFSGNENVHGLYDFLLNYRFFLTSLAGVDVPVLYSPVPFQNAALSAPEVRCKEVRRVDHSSFPLKECNMNDEPNQGSSAGFCYSIEIKDAYIPPWIICSVCEALSSEAMSFEASFGTEHASIGLNAGLEIITQKSNPQATTVEGLQEISHAFGIRNTILSPHLRSAFLKGLKYCNDSYTASISPV
uniref:Protein downstream neighbor of Son n=1 Tax=Davidia involucrata TaxID=16924 RepID=A0A5B6YNX2_DAVIN